MHRTAILGTGTVHPQARAGPPYTADLARAGVIGACSHASPGSHEVSRTGLPRLDRVAFPGTKPAPLRSRATRQQSPCAPPPTWRPTRACPPAASARSPASHSRSPLPCSSRDFTCRARGPAALEQDSLWPGTGRGFRYRRVGLSWRVPGRAGDIRCYVTSQPPEVHSPLDRALGSRRTMTVWRSVMQSPGTTTVPLFSGRSPSA